MRRLAVIAVLLSAGCSDPAGPGGPLDGEWVLVSPRLPLDPRTLHLTQLGTAVEGQGTAMGVDGPMPLSVGGTLTGSFVILTFRFTNGSGLTGRYSATYDGLRLSGSAVFTDGIGASHDLVYRRNQ